MSAHDDMLESVALLALGTLPESEAAAVAAHARGCRECRAAYAELRIAADAIGYDAELDAAGLSAEDSARMKARVMNAVRTSAETPATSVVRPLSSAPSFGTPALARTTWLAYAAAAAALIVAVVSSANYALVRKRAEIEADAVARGRAFEARVAQLIAPGSRHYAVSNGEVVASGGRIFIALRDLPAPGPGKVYQAWTLQAGAKAVAPSITFLPDPGGVTVVELPRAAAGLAAVAISIEPAGGSKAPTSKPAFVRKLS